MSLNDFFLHRPQTVAEACELGLKHGQDAAYLAGGTDLLVDLRSGRRSVAHVISLAELAEFQLIRLEDNHLRIGSMARMVAVSSSLEVQESCPALCSAIDAMAGRQIRNLATLGGNICCGVPCSDTPPVLCACDADLVMLGGNGERTVAVRDFFLAPRVTVLEPGEVLAEIRIPARSDGSGAAFQRFALRSGSALAVASVAAWVKLDAEEIADARVVLGAVGPVPIYADRCAQELVGKLPSAESFAAAGSIAAEEARPISDLRGSEQYRREIVEVLAARALEEAVTRARGGGR
ncbi:MAG: xanthine dehydrogenase family protein subunit M [bacterium]|nr:xanthine dehydrogenase family protein subunit M [bacterium]